MCTDCESTDSKMNRGAPGYNGMLKKPTAMVSKTTNGFGFGPYGVSYGTRKASEIIGRQKMPPMPKKRVR